jgi:hypothetical protein
MTRGDPKSPLRWTCKSELANELNRLGHWTAIEWWPSCCGNTSQPQDDGRSRHGDRDQQFQHIQLLNQRQPVISVDTKKKV